MADITMCPGYDCHIKSRCYRHRAAASQYQSFAIFNRDEYVGKWAVKPIRLEKDCNDFWDMEDREID